MKRALQTHASTQSGAKGKSMKLRLVTTVFGLAAMAALPMMPVAAKPHKHTAHAAKKAAKPALQVKVTQGSMPAPGVTAPARSLALGIGRGELVTLPGNMTDVFVANESIADVQVKSGNQLYVFGKTGGETTVYASNGRGDVVWSANVRVGTNIDSVDQMLHLAMPDAHIATATMNNTILLTGTVASPEDAAEAERLVKAFVGEKTTVISRLKMATPLQVSLHVKIAEVSRSLLRNINNNITSINGQQGFQYGIGQGSTSTYYAPGMPMGVNTTSVTGWMRDPTAVTATNPLGLVKAPGTAVPATQSGTTLALTGHLLGLDLLDAINLGETIGLVTTLAEPNMTALSGETADFLAGGEFPIPLSTGLGTVSVDYKHYGVSLSYTPTVLANGRISLRVRPEVSELTSNGAVSLNGYSIPALTVRRAETTVELGSGQSFMIAGLLKNTSNNTITKMPGAGDIPVLGSLFRSTSYQRGETELVIVVTPYLVNPVDANDIHLPTDGYKSASALQQLLGNMENDSDKASGERPKPTEKPVSPQTGASDGKVGAADRPRKNKTASADAQPGFSIQ